MTPAIENRNRVLFCVFFSLSVFIYIFISPQMVDNKQYEKKNKNKQK